MPDDMPQKNDDQLDSLLQTLELRLETPIVPGEMRSWLENLRNLWDRLPATLSQTSGEENLPKLKQIAATDPELDARVQRMHDEDAQIAAEALRLQQAIESVHQQVGSVEEAAQLDEGQLSEQVSTIIDRSLALIIRIRKQQRAIDTWFVEALQRDRGVAD